MPHSDIHKKKLRKNLTIALMIFLWCALIWAVTMIKIARADDYQGGSRMAHQIKMLDTQQQWQDDYQNKAGMRDIVFSAREQARHRQLDKNTNSHGIWNQIWSDKSAVRLDNENNRDNQRQSHLDHITENPQQWWSIWTQHQQEKSEKP